jgi:hypothetical protein
MMSEHGVYDLMVIGFFFLFKIRIRKLESVRIRIFEVASERLAVMKKGK